MKVDLKKAKRNPSFTTRRRTQSFRKHRRMEDMANLPPVEIQGYLERKQELQSGGKKATIRSWKTFYTVLCGQLLCFFKDEEDFYDQKAASPPISIHQARVEIAEDYTKKKHVFRLITRDNAEYLLLAESGEHLEEWVTKLCFHAQLPPSMQLMSYDNHKEGEVGSDLVAVPSRDSDNSSGHSTPEVRHRTAVSSHPQGAGGGLDPTRPHSQALDNPLYANLEHMQDKTKPPVPPRGSTGSNRSSRSSLGEEGPIYQNRISVVPSYEVAPVENTYHNDPPTRPNGHRRNSLENMNGDDLPPLPSSAPPMVMARPPVPPGRARYSEHSWVGGQQQHSMSQHVGGPHYPHHQMGHHISQHHHQVSQHHMGQHYSHVSQVSHHQYAYTSHGSPHHPDALDGIPGSRQPYSEYSSRTSMSLPQGSSLPSGGPSVNVTTGPMPSHRYSASIDRQGLSESSSEGDVPVSANKKEKEKKGSVFKFFGRRKGAQV